MVVLRGGRPDRANDVAAAGGRRISRQADAQGRLESQPEMSVPTSASQRGRQRNSAATLAPQQQVVQFAARTAFRDLDVAWARCETTADVFGRGLRVAKNAEPTAATAIGTPMRCPV